MRPSSSSSITTPLALLLAAAGSILAQDLSRPIVITQEAEVNQRTRVGRLAYGASNLDFGYAAGVGINFGRGTVGGGFNAGVPGAGEDGAMRGQWTVSADNITFGLEAAFGGVAVEVAARVDPGTGKLTVWVNGEEVRL
ncbi:uncharacterized protein L3040_005121 [Drepanopeziza brunnea f. sp. 'multigermtubi']|uniref:Secreted protein n=1 Tax=Marssonina brunnea f. sp. multigermtubi (strain MB_m1) TaxID=1072389 RepID=K1WYG0_MARBU|nr:uncharacterized protein MBM_08351 [Drepanopeziza brunnea f. sp. 'multigermtubi' MB_m1]EKD13633.1 hypothetical protein MBM_08351 [Drepanopeziza brunnea f. sp. 'multigermtubi' MB_m1]KAJ5041538.1 hypothetical protein L3040_005121 [Drepanopeziza brunnea f. sp. 'multigermtubi']